MTNPLRTSVRCRHSISHFSRQDVFDTITVFKETVVKDKHKPESHPAICSCTKSCLLRCFVAYPAVSLPFQNFQRPPLRKTNTIQYVVSHLHINTNTVKTENWNLTHWTATYYFCHVTVPTSTHMLLVRSAVCAFLAGAAGVTCCMAYTDATKPLDH